MPSFGGTEGGQSTFPEQVPIASPCYLTCPGPGLSPVVQLLLRWWCMWDQIVLYNWGPTLGWVEE